MGGLGQRAAVHANRSSWSARSRSSASRRSRASSRRTRSSRRTLDHGGAFGYFLVRRLPRRRVPDRPLHVPALLHRLRRRAVRRSPQEHLHEQPRPPRGAALDGLAGRRARRARRSSRGFIQFTPFWEPITHWLDPVAAPLIEATGTQELIASVARRRARRSPGSASRYAALRRARRCAVPKPVPLLEQKFYFDELYDAVFYKPADADRARARALRRAAADRGLDRARSRAASASARSSSAASRTASSAPTRSRSRAGIAVLAVVFIASAMTELADDDPDLPADGRRARRLARCRCSRQWVGSLATLVSLVEVGFWIARVQRFDFDDSSLQLDQQHSWFSVARRQLLRRASSASRSGSSG